MVFKVIGTVNPLMPQPQIRITQCYLQTTPYLSLTPYAFPDGATMQQTPKFNWLHIYRPQEDDWLSWPCWLIYCRQFTHRRLSVNCTPRRRPGKVRRLESDILTTVLRRQEVASFNMCCCRFDTSVISVRLGCTIPQAVVRNYNRSPYPLSQWKHLCIEGNDNDNWHIYSSQGHFGTDIVRLVVCDRHTLGKLSNHDNHKYVRCKTVTMMIYLLIIRLRI